MDRGKQSATFTGLNNFLTAAVAPHKCPQKYQQEAHHDDRKYDWVNCELSQSSTLYGNYVLKNRLLNISRHKVDISSAVCTRDCFPALPSMPIRKIFQCFDIILSLPYAVGRPRRQRQDKDTADRRSGSAHLIKTVPRRTST